MNRGYKRIFQIVINVKKKYNRVTWEWPGRGSGKGGRSSGKVWRWNVHWNLEGKEPTLQRSGERTVQGKGGTSAKTLRWEWLWHLLGQKLAQDQTDWVYSKCKRKHLGQSQSRRRGLAGGGGGSSQPAVGRTGLVTFWEPPVRNRQSPPTAEQEGRT